MESDAVKVFMEWLQAEEMYVKNVRALRTRFGPAKIWSGKADQRQIDRSMEESQNATFGHDSAR
jgi:hypothetical protein